MIDFSRSFCTWLLPEQPSYGRFSLESCLFYTPTQSPEEHCFILGASVMAADVYGKGPLLKDPAYRFELIASQAEYRILRSYPLPPENEDAFADTGGETQSRFKTLNIHLCPCEADPLSTGAEILAATLTQRALVGEILLPFGSQGIRLVFPVKHINCHQDTLAFQVETGPLLMPDPDPPASAEALSPERLTQAYVVFNRLDQAEFCLRRSYPRENDPARRIRAYGDARTLDAKIRLYALR